MRLSSQQSVAAALLGAVALALLISLPQEGRKRTELQSATVRVPHGILEQGMRVLKQIEKREQSELAPVLKSKAMSSMVRSVLNGKQQQLLQHQQQVKRVAASAALSKTHPQARNIASGDASKHTPSSDEMTEKQMHTALGFKTVEGFGRLDGMGDKEIPYAVAFDGAPAKRSRRSEVLRRAEAVAEARRAAERRQQRNAMKAPGGWAVYVDKASGRPYYFNSVTGKSTWHYPSHQLLK
eukprot:CAMPEP_0181323904 /NCGR_PEP_ID=MMETSP1101-20121128/20053_1 /TAXON_ID=46948 /ORGANISM="Rhodomonas abbreviata, Strain Caron Lab Isolate" /LENGTH=238 /DNA_ID=CAMNT_0023432001 /DNA_START=28 /DNA_END=741 /DNA_ORIENTATION=+